MNDTERAIVSAGVQAAKASLSLQMQAIGTAQGPPQPTDGFSTENPTSPSINPLSQIPLPEGPTEGANKDNWITVQSRNSKGNRARKADAAEINTPSSPPNLFQKTESIIAPILPTEVKGYSPVAIISATENGKVVDLSSVSPVLFAKLLAGALSAGAIEKVETQRVETMGTAKVTAANRDYLAELLIIQKLGEWDIEVTAVERKRCYGVITNIHTAITEKEISQDILSPIPILKAERLKRKGEIATSCVKITFDGPKLPEKVKFGFLIHPVREFVPEPVQCYNCRRWGHIAKACKGQQCCARCGQEHETQNCLKKDRSEFSCINCGGNHSAAYGGCKNRKEAQQINKAAVEHNIPRKSAAAVIQSGRTFASVTSSSAPQRLEVENTRATSTQQSLPQIRPLEIHPSQRERELEQKLDLVLNLLVEVMDLLSSKDKNPTITRIMEAVKPLLKEPRITSSKRRNKKARREKESTDGGGPSSKEKETANEADVEDIDITGSDGTGTTPVPEAVKKQRKENWRQFQNLQTNDGNPNGNSSTSTTASQRATSV